MTKHYEFAQIINYMVINLLIVLQLSASITTNVVIFWTIILLNLWIDPPNQGIYLTLVHHLLLLLP